MSKYILCSYKQLAKQWNFAFIKNSEDFGHHIVAPYGDGKLYLPRCYQKGVQYSFCGLTRLIPHQIKDRTFLLICRRCYRANVLKIPPVVNNVTWVYPKRGVLM